MKALKIFSVAAIVSALMIGFSQALPADETGSISGVIHPAEAMASVEAYLDGVVVASVDADPETGEFVIDGLSAGNYAIGVTPWSEGYRSKTLNDVQIEAGENADLGDIQLEPYED
jgi:hypothetical protein